MNPFINLINEGTRMLYNAYQAGVGNNPPDPSYAAEWSNGSTSMPTHAPTQEAARSLWPLFVVLGLIGGAGISCACFAAYRSKTNPLGPGVKEDVVSNVSKKVEAKRPEIIVNLERETTTYGTLDDGEHKMKNLKKGEKEEI